VELCCVCVRAPIQPGFPLFIFAIPWLRWLSTIWMVVARPTLRAAFVAVFSAGRTTSSPLLNVSRLANVLTNGRMYYKTHAIRNISLVHRGTFYTLITAFWIIDWRLRSASYIIVYSFCPPHPRVGAHCTVWRDFRHLGSQCSHLNRIFHNITAFWIVTFILT
jgi:hypothetical protein